MLSLTDDHQVNLWDGFLMDFSLIKNQAMLNHNIINYSVKGYLDATKTDL